MGWIILEALVALALAVGIVWWTMGPKKKRAPSVTGTDAGDGRGDKADDGAPR